jgi:hypothetical protein
MRLLIYGAGVIGSFYATLFSKAGYDTYVYARGKRLDSLKACGLLYMENGRIKKASVSILSKLYEDDIFDFIFVTVRENQVCSALSELKSNRSKCIVTMVNSTGDYKKWEKFCGKGRILPAFPGAGGSIKDDILDASLTSRLIQPTTFGEFSCKNSKRLKMLSNIFKKSKIPYQQVTNMHIWQLCHLAMVVPLADAYYEAVDIKNVGNENPLMLKTAKRLRRNFGLLKKHFGKLSPYKMNLFLLLPPFFSARILKFIFNSDFGDKFMYRHSLNARDEMRVLHEKFYNYCRNLLYKRNL